MQDTNSHFIVILGHSLTKQKEEPRNYLSAPLAFQALDVGYFAVAAVHQGFEPFDLVLIVDVDFEVEVGPISAEGPGEISAVGRRQSIPRRTAEIGGRESGAGAVEDSGEEEGGGDEEEGSDLVRAGAGSVAAAEGSSFIIVSAHQGRGTTVWALLVLDYNLCLLFVVKFSDSLSLFFSSNFARVAKRRKRKTKAEITTTPLLIFKRGL